MDNWAEKAVSKFGIIPQVDMLQEECAELIVAANKYKRGNPEGLLMMMEEICDVEIMIEQMKKTLFVDCPLVLEDIKTKKIERLKNIIKKSEPKIQKFGRSPGLELPD